MCLALARWITNAECGVLSKAREVLEELNIGTWLCLTMHDGVKH